MASTKTASTAPVTGSSPRGIPEGKGPYGVGCLDVMAGLSTSGVFFRLFYPMDKTPDGPPKKDRPAWLPSGHYAKGYGAVAGSRLAGVTIKLMFSKFTLPVWWHGKLSDSRGAYPLVIYSHGLGGCRTTYTSTCIDIASTGCIVAAVEHRDQSACCSFTINNNNSVATEKNGHNQQEWVNYRKAPYEVQELRTKQVNQRKDECIAVLDFLQDLNEGAETDNDLDPDFDLSIFQNRFDFENVAVCGHSFGGATTIACLSRDERFKCGVGFDVWMFPLDESHMKVKQPLLLVNTEKFQWRMNLVEMMKLVPDLAATTGPRQMITIWGTVHQSQSDFSLLMPSFLCKMTQMRGELNPHVAMAINNDAAIRFFSKYIDIQAGDETDSPVSAISDHIIIGTNVELKRDGEDNQEQKKEDESGEGSTNDRGPANEDQVSSQQEQEGENCEETRKNEEQKGGEGSGELAGREEGQGGTEDQSQVKALVNGEKDGEKDGHNLDGRDRGRAEGKKVENEGKSEDSSVEGHESISKY